MDGKGSERFDTVVVGAGQAGLSAGYHLKRAGRSFVILDANDRIGGSWRKRYDSLRLFTPSWAVDLPGWRFPRKTAHHPTKDQMADYLEAYADRFDLPVRTGVDVQRISRVGDRYVLSLADGRIEADHVIVASGADRDPRIPAFSRELDPGIVQMHSSAYRNPSQLRDGRGSGGRGGQLGRRHLARRRRLAPDVAVRAPSRARAGGHRHVGGAERGVPGDPVLRRPRPDAPDADGPQGEGEGRVPGRHAGPRQAQAARGRRYRTRPEDRRRHAAGCRCSRTAGCSTWRT